MTDLQFVLGRHGMQSTEASVGAKEPGLQSVHDVEPLLLLYEPTQHTSHTTTFKSSLSFHIITIERISVSTKNFRQRYDTQYDSLKHKKKYEIKTKKYNDTTKSRLSGKPCVVDMLLNR